MKTNFKPGLITISAALLCGLGYTIYKMKKAQKEAGAGQPFTAIVDLPLLALSTGAGYTIGALIAAYD